MTKLTTNAYLRLEKNGSDFTGSASADGQTWVEVWTETVTGGPDNFLAGLAVTAGDSETRRQAAQISFCQIDLKGGAPPAGPSFHRGDALQLTDAVRILNFLFLGTGRIDCMDAADADNNGTVQLTDAVRILNVLFLGTGTIPDPGPPGESFGNKPCGIDPDDSHVGCEVYDKCV